MPSEPGPAAAPVDRLPLARQAFEPDLDQDLESLAEQLAVRLAQSERGAGLPALVTHRRTSGRQVALAAAVAVALVATMLVAMTAVGLLL